MKIGLIPLDERPVNTRHPQMIAAIAGVEVIEPPPAILSHLHNPANCSGLIEWMDEFAGDLDYLVVSIETLGYGGLIASRTTQDSIAAVVERIEHLRQIKNQYPQLKIYGFDLVMRISNSYDSAEEPPYWKNYGEDFFRFSQLYDMAQKGHDVEAELNALRQQIPADYIQDFIKRRMRNHTVNLAVLDLMLSDVFDLLVISSDDTSEFGLGTREKSWINEWVDRSGGDHRLLMYPGADEVGAALVARAILNYHGQIPQFYLHYAIEQDKDRTAPFEDGPVSTTLARQIRAVGGQITTNEQAADFIVAVNTPAPNSKGFYDYDPQVAEAERAYRLPHLPTFTTQINTWLDAGKQIIVVDVAYPNGSDPVLVELLREHTDITQLAAYGAWNTAGNTIGTALAQGIAASLAQNNTHQIAQQHFLLHRFLEDWGYQHVSRQTFKHWLAAYYHAHHIQWDGGAIDPAYLDDAKQFVETELQKRLEELPMVSQSWRLKIGSVRLPWKRTFEVDFDVEQQDS